MDYKLTKSKGGEDWCWWDGDRVKGTALTDDRPESKYCGTFSASVTSTDEYPTHIGRYDTHEKAVEAAKHAMKNNKTYAEWLKELDG